MFSSFQFIIFWPSSNKIDLQMMILPKLSDSFRYERLQVAEDEVKNDLDRAKVNHPFSEIDPKRFLFHI